MSQQLIMANELGSTPGYIRSVSFDYYYSSPSTAKTDCEIWIGLTSLSSLSTSQLLDTSQMTKVYAGPLNCSQGWNAFNTMQLDNSEQIDLLATQYMEKLKKLPYKNTKVKLMEQLLKRVIDSVKKVNKVKAVSFTERLNGIIDKYNDRSDDIVLADEIVTEVAKQLADLFEEIKKDSVLPDGIPNIEVKAFYDILKSVAEQYGFVDEYTEEQYIALAKDVKEVVDDKTQYIDWDKKADIKAQLKVQIILTLAKHKYPPATRDEVFKAIFEQAENFKKNRNVTSHSDARPYQVDEEYERIMVSEDYE